MHDFSSTTLQIIYFGWNSILYKKYKVRNINILIYIQTVKIKDNFSSIEEQESVILIKRKFTLKKYFITLEFLEVKRWFWY